MLRDVLLDVECVAAGSTCGVESGFSKGEYVFWDRQCRASQELENHYLKLAQDYEDRDPNVVTMFAQDICKENSGTARVSGVDNRKRGIGAGTKRKLLDDGITNASFNRGLQKYRRIGIDTIPEV